jgi:regulator of sirC expression with transglutaminase-like and TPR domain
VSKLDRLARRAEKHIAARIGFENVVPTIVPLLEFLYEDLGFCGNATDYYDPRNSYLNQVLDRKTGIPITLAVVILALSRRLDIPADGVSFPGHFLVRSEDTMGNPLFIDPFDGRVLDDEGLQRLYEQATPTAADLEGGLLQPVGSRQILTRMLNNLRLIYEAGADESRLRQTLERLAVLNPSEEIEAELRTLGRIPMSAATAGLN